ncbi:MAG TPA: hypothetical protein VER33_01055 [Polyangiaceae bacterium]|nr:hypothetical protein [Polyangiaceae bacterium]
MSKYVLPALLAVAGCGDRADKWETPFVLSHSVNLSGSVALVDARRNEALMLTSRGPLEVNVERLAIGRNVVAAVASRDKQQLFVLTRGVERRLNAGDERPRLSVIDGGTQPRIKRSYELDDPLQKLAIDPLGEWAVAYDAGGVVVNVNELILAHVAQPERETFPKTIRSKGGQPERFTFTTKLQVPGGGSHRLLVVETVQQVSILDLDNPEARDIAIDLPRTKSGGVAEPAQVIFQDDLPGDEEVAAYLAIRFKNDSNVLTLRLNQPAPGSSAAFSLVPNMVDAGAQPSTIEFVRTERGLRLAALVPSRPAAVLFDPATSKSELVELDQPYSGIARVTALVNDAPSSADVALLYSNQAASIAFWRLGLASGTPYASFESYPVDNLVTEVLDVPGEDFAHLKLLRGSDGAKFFLLDLKSRQSSPMRALSGLSLRLSPDGQRAWAYRQGTPDIAQLLFENQHSISLAVERPVNEVFDIQQSVGAGRTAIVLHASGSGQASVGAGTTSDAAVTLFDAVAPDSAQTRFVSGLMWEGI